MSRRVKHAHERQLPPGVVQKYRELAQQVLHGRIEGQMMDGDGAYVLFRWRGPDVSLVFYPHRTSAGNYHIRVRDDNSADKPLARDAALLLYAATADCTFSHKLGAFYGKGYGTNRLRVSWRPER